MTRARLLVAAIVALGLVLFLTAHTSAFTVFGNGKDQVCSGATAASEVCKSTSTDTNPVLSVIKTATNLIALFAGALAVIMIIVSGFTLVTSAGNQEAVTNSRKRITSSVIGLAIVALSWTIISLVIDKLIK